MQENKDKELVLLSDKTYIFSINVISYAKTIGKKLHAEENNVVNSLVFLSGNLSELLIEATEKNNNAEKIVILQKSHIFAKNLLEQLQNYKTDKVLLNEKTDLQIENYQISKSINELILKFSSQTQNYIQI